MKRYSITALLFFCAVLCTAAPPHPKYPEAPRTKPKQIGLVLGGGGALGFAHVGAIQALEDYGIRVQMVAGSSMGAIIGSLYAAGYSANDILQVIKKERLYKLGRIVTVQSALSSKGASSHATLQRELKALIPHNSFEKLKIPFVVCVTDLDMGESLYIDHGEQLAEYVVASASIPGVFESKIIDGSEYVDGGVLDNMPAIALRERGCDYVVGIDVLPYLQNKKKRNSLDVALWALRLMQHSNSIRGRDLCNFVVQPYALVEFHEFDFNRYLEIYQYGYKAMSKYLAEHPEVVNKLTSLM